MSSISRATPHIEQAATSHPFISWRSILAGLVIAFLISATLLSLGAAVGGVSLIGGVDVTAAPASLLSAAWILGSAIIALGAGGYFAARVSKFSTPSIGSAQGFVIAALFLGITIGQAASIVGWAAKAAGAAAASVAAIAGAGATGAAQTQVGSTAIEDALGDLNLKSSPQAVMTGVASRLAHGDARGAKTYLARQAGISEAEANRRINEANSRLQADLRSARDTAGHVIQTLGLSLFLALFLGTAAAISGGAMGSRRNERMPLARESNYGADRDLTLSTMSI